MDNIVLGGNIVKVLDLVNEGKHTLGTGPYEYYIYKSKFKEEILIKELKSFTIFIIEKDNNCSILIDEVNQVINKLDAVQVEDKNAKISIDGGSATLLIAGTKESSPGLKGIFFTNFKNLYKVDKPWGHELWINGEHQCYAFKQIFIKSGTKTSLQFHNYKQETNVLFSGEAKLHFKKSPKINNDNVGAKDIGSFQLYPVSSIDVVPLTLHRIEAINDILLYEISTPHLDDVVRVSDDAKRPSGRILQEHSK